jgi:hypothetical protein
MAFRMEDFKKICRKAPGAAGGSKLIYPHQMRGKKPEALVAAAISTFDGLVGRRRGDLDAAVMSDIFGDPRLARGVIACLGRWYRYDAPAFTEIVSESSAKDLSDSGITSPLSVRAKTYDYVNRHCSGFLRESERSHAYLALGEPFGVAAHEWERLLYLDRADNQILSRLSVVPTASDVAASYNFHSIDTVLRRASRMTIQGLSLSAEDYEDIRQIASDLGVSVELSAERSLTLSCLARSAQAPQRPGRLARLLLLLIQSCGAKEASGSADAVLGSLHGRMTLTPEVLTAYGMLLSAEAPSRLPQASLRCRWGAASALHASLVKQRTKEGTFGWRISRFPDAVVSSQGVLLPDVTLSRGGRSLHLVFGTETGLQYPDVLPVAWAEKAPDAACLFARAANALDGLANQQKGSGQVPPLIHSLCDRAASVGLVPVADVQRALHLIDESPLLDWVRRASDPRVRYVPGVGLCSLHLVDAIHALPAA